MKKNTLIDKIQTFIINAIVMIFSFTCIFPVLWLVYSSMKTQKEFSLSIISIPAHPNLDNYIDIMNGGKIPRYFMNSIFISLISVSLIVALAFVTGYFLSRYRFRGRNIIYIMFLSGMLIPVHSLLIPIFIEFRGLGLLNNRITLILPYIALGLPLAIFLFDSFIHTIPIEMEEAAYIDGLTIPKLLMYIILPMCRPVISTIIILSFLYCWNEFPFALVLISSEAFKTIPIGLANFSGALTAKYTLLMAALVIATLPVLIVYLAFYKKIIQGMTAGAVKG